MLPAAVDAVINVISTAAFPSAGTLYLGRETITYLGVTSTTFTGCSRGQYGSTAQRHFAATTILQALGAPPVLDAPAEVVGRLASVWMLRVSGTTITHASLLFLGHVGPGAILAYLRSMIEEIKVEGVKEAAAKYREELRNTYMRKAA